MRSPWANTLSCRSPYGTYRDRLEISNDAYRAARRLVILIHGFKNSRDDAANAYADWRSALSASLPTSADKRLGDVWEFYWPGDHENWIISRATYPVRVPVAQNAGPLLARDFLAMLQPHQSVYLVAHSLGCRVALEAIRWIRKERKAGRYDGARVDAVFLLAAAVPVPFCEFGADEETQFPVPYAGSGEHVFFSRNDKVLRRLFVPGQLIYGEPGPAVGLHGAPETNRWTSRKPTEHGHSDYWTSEHVLRKIGEVSWLRDRRDAPVQQLPHQPSETQRLPEEHADEHVLNSTQI